MKKKLDLRKIDRLSRVIYGTGISKRSPILLEFSLFSAQISGFSADCHRKLLDIVKQRPNNARIWADSVFQPSYQGSTLMNISLMIWFDKNWELENGKKKNRDFDVPKSS